MRKLKLSLIFALCFLILFVSAGYAEEIHVAVIGKSVHPYWAEVELGVKKAAEDLGVKATFFVPQKEDIQAQISQMESFIAMGVDGIAIAPSDPTALAPTIATAMSKGIPVITLDTDAPESERIAYIGTDNYSAGKLAGQVMSQLLGPEGGKVAIGTGSLTAMNSLERMRGFTDGIADNENIVVVTKPALCDFEDTGRAVTLVEQALLTYPDLKGFFGVYAINGPAAAKAIKTAGKVGEVLVVCFDTTAEHMQLIKEGAIAATIGQRPYMMGYKSVELLSKMVADGVDAALAELPEDRIVDTGVDVVAADAYVETLRVLEADSVEEYREKLIGLGIPVEGW
ncbi:MAG TPA: sugar-binding protein [Candidatus Atribacteria bacterium]|jgi:ribose transport system substrate-binding protein|uniref:sugar-binding protein n=1 Tax=Candidatus Sordicultor fermentans TaxID=1953203 RepID=UPI0016B05A7C|nr:substrate-binding domain-containing protein [Candidatus Atribacteria bacterium]HPT64035.1 sugar-binding protein [Candidatus Atribacteria bacterium]